MLNTDSLIIELTPDQLEMVSGGKYGGKGTSEGHGTRGVGPRDRSGPVDRGRIEKGKGCESSGYHVGGSVKVSVGGLLGKLGLSGELSVDAGVEGNSDNGQCGGGRNK